MFLGFHRFSKASPIFFGAFLKRFSNSESGGPKSMFSGLGLSFGPFFPGSFLRKKAKQTSRS